ncbi:hypothetical protein SKAU_G00082380 [Synaphobranchus kaupii]|uniref:Uncharacterized protein n=1 Tax=Synaphobranchus kaupii TaxID=118154 RepID=A0A9Q1FV23_SYNKA|nr:hypothetical protein SKAU_G00082380 [Synaphobranchus kaupii]
MMLERYYKEESRGRGSIPGEFHRVLDRGKPSCPTAFAGVAESGTCINHDRRRTVSVAAASASTQRDRSTEGPGVGVFLAQCARALICWRLAWQLRENAIRRSGIYRRAPAVHMRSQTDISKKDTSSG